MKTLVIKVGGAFLQNGQIALSLLEVLQQLQQHYRVVLVHGGGALVEDLMQKLNLSSDKIDGLRITPPEHMPYISGALAGTANKQLCALAIQAGLQPIGLSLADGNLTRCAKINPQLGAVGQAEPGDATLAHLLLNNGYLPIISSIAADHQGQLLNVNADEAATVLAKLLDGELLFLSDVPGVLDGDKQLILELTTTLAQQLTTQGVIKAGMIVKVNAAQQAADSLQRAVFIAGWNQPKLLLDFINKQCVGTKVIPATLAEAHKLAEKNKGNNQ